ncbi:MAG: hypothetical protein KC443_13475, partial [Anaerolineales bacterium]|nr:hypothetical protein [Anaerolineales bacterium]
GTTIIVDADILPTYTLEALQTLNGRYQPQLISDLIKLGQQQNTPVSRDELVAALNGRWQPGAASQPNPILEAAALLFLLQRTAETAVSHRHSLILRYEEPAPVQTPLRTGWWLAQIRPFLLADFFALIFILIAFLRTDLWRRDGGILFWHEPLLTYLLLFLGFSWPMWLAQGYIYWHARRANPAVCWISGAQAAQVAPERLRPFLLAFSPRPFILAALYQPEPAAPVPLPKPTRIYGILSVLCLMMLAALLPVMPLDPWIAQYFAAFTLSSFIFGLSHLLADK